MSRKATKLAYGQSINESCLTMCERMVLRAICWAVHPQSHSAKSNATDPLTDHDLMRMTGYQSRPPIIDARKRLKALNLINFRPTPDNATAGYIYYVVFDRVAALESKKEAK